MFAEKGDRDESSHSSIEGRYEIQHREGTLQLQISKRSKVILIIVVK